MIDPVSAWAAGALVGACSGFLSGWICRAWMERRDPFTRWWRRSPYSLSKIWLAATKEDADKFGSRFVDPSFGEPRPERMTVDQWARSCSKPRELLCFGEPVRLDEGPVQRGNGSGGPSTPKPEIVPKPQYSGGYISLDGAQPFRVRGRLQPLPDELDAYTYQRGPQGGTPNPPPEVP